MGTTKPMKRETEDLKKNQARTGFDYGMEEQSKTIGWKRYQNWMADLQGMKRGAPDEGILKQPCPSGFRFREGSCVAHHMVDQVRAAQDWNKNREEDLPRSLSMELFNKDYSSDGTSMSERFWQGDGGDGFIRNSFLEKDEEITMSDDETVSKRAEKAFHRVQPDKESMKNFKKRAEEKIKEAERRDELRRQHRVDIGVEPDWSRFKSGAQITLNEDEIHDESRMKELHRNMSALLKLMEKDLNVTSKQTNSWWRGEDEDWIDEERLRLIAEWEAQLTTARNLASSFKIKNAINKKVLRRVAEKMTFTNDQVEYALKEENLRASPDGPWNAWDQLPYHNRSDDLFLKAEKVYNISRRPKNMKKEKKDEDVVTTESVETTTAAPEKKDAVDAALESLRKHLPKNTKHRVSSAERDFLRATINATKPMMSMIRDPETGEWREEVFVPNKLGSFREEGVRIVDESSTNKKKHDPMDVLKHYAKREVLWNEHSKRLEVKTRQLEAKLKRARMETEASRRLRRRQRHKGGNAMNP